eukprot:3717765-Rhodomonas_salina.2
MVPLWPVCDGDVVWAREKWANKNCVIENCVLVASAWYPRQITPYNEKGCLQRLIKARPCPSTRQTRKPQPLPE